MSKNLRLEAVEDLTGNRPRPPGQFDRLIKVGIGSGIMPKKEAAKARAPKVPGATTLLTKEDLYLFNEGSHFQLHEKLGAHLITTAGAAGTYFAVWAPSAERGSVIGDFNRWD